MQTNTNDSALPIEETTKLVTKAKLAKRYMVCVRTIENWISERRIPVIRLRKSVRLDPTKCDAALARFEVCAAGDRKGGR